MDSDNPNFQVRLYRLYINNESVGPYTEIQLHQMVNDGQLSPMTLIWTEGMPNWSQYQMVFMPSNTQLASPPVQNAPIPPNPDTRRRRKEKSPYSLGNTNMNAMNKSGRSSIILWGSILFCLGFAAGYGCNIWLDVPSSPSLSAKSSSTKTAKKKQKARALLEEKYNITDVSKREGEDGLTLLHFAATDNNTEKADLLIAAGAEIDASDARGRTPLSYAISKSSFEVAKVLLDAGANINAGKYDGSALERSIDARNVEGVKFALAHGADINKKSPDGKTYLMQAVDWAQLPDAAELLINAGIDLHAVNREGRTALDMANSRSSGNTTWRCIEIVEKALKREPYVNAMAKAIGDNNKKELQRQAKRAAADLYDNRCVFDIFLKGETLLMLAVRSGNVGLVEYMLQEGADPSITSIQGLSAYQIATDNNLEACAKLLNKKTSKGDRN